MSAPDQAMVLAAGEGRRLRPLTERCPKPLVPFLNVPLLEHTLAALAAAGIRRVVVNAWHHADQIDDFVARRPADAMSVQVVREPELLGTAGGIRNLWEHLERRPVLVLAGDIVADFDLAALGRHHAGSAAVATMALTAAADPAVFGAVEVDDASRVTDIVGLVGRPGARAFVNASAHVLDPRFVERLPLSFSCLVRDGYVPALRDGLPVGGWIHPGSWHETGTPRALLAAQRAALDGTLSVDAGLLARGGRRGPGPALVHPTARVADTARLLDGTVVGAGARIGAGAVLQRCLILPGAAVPDGCVLEDQLVQAAVDIPEECSP